MASSERCWKILASSTNDPGSFERILHLLPTPLRLLPQPLRYLVHSTPPLEIAELTSRRRGQQRDWLRAGGLGGI